MLGPAPGVGCFLAVLALDLGLVPVLTHSAEKDPGFSLCSHCFYRQTPPLGFSEGGLSSLCHRLPGGQELAMLYSPTCDTAVYSAFRHSRGREEREEEEGEAVPGTEEKPDEPVEEAVEDEGSQIDVPPGLIPALLSNQGAESTDSPLHSWDSLVTKVIQDSFLPQCSSTGGDVFVLTGTTGEESGEACETRVVWAAVCCTAPEAGFNVGLLRDTEGGERVVSVKELEETVGVTELFSGGCGGAGEEAEVGVATLVEEALARTVEQQKAEGTVADLTEDEVPNEVQSYAAPVTSESLSSSEDNEALASDTDADTESGSALMYILSSSFYLLTSPLRPVVSTITQLPGQVTYVLQEDLGVLTALPGDTLSLFHLMASDLASGLGSAKDLLVGLGQMSFSCLYSCTAPLLEALITSCQTGVMGIGTLAGDGVGILGGMVDSAWWVTSLFGGRLWEQSEGYVGAVVSELGGQATTVGGGVGTLMWGCGHGVGNIVKMAQGLVVGGVENVVGNIVKMAQGLVGGGVENVVGGVTEAFGQDSG
ncbi:endonuclease domain-containing 1 protein [Osmerus mordax]|uniref:endonuclease domain-containing 1 protein n=1 Tax=Osmerus mordax TaxID=8014 RepID=UPI0035104E2C